MGTYNGSLFIKEQLDTIAQQTHTNWRLVVSDDGSLDKTLEILAEYASRWPEARLTVRPGPRQGFCRNFLSLACDPGITSEFYAFADQDDIWEPEKIERAVAWLETIPPAVPAIYCGRTKIIDAKGKDLGRSILYRHPPHFRNALVQSIGGGNTMVFNEAARQLLVIATPKVKVPSHDWWLYILVSGCGGLMKYDPCPYVNYRQHGGNIIGRNTNFTSKIKRLGRVFNGQFREWNDLHLAALESMREKLTPDSINTLSEFSLNRRADFVTRIAMLSNKKVYRQTRIQQIGLLVALALKWA